MAKLIQSSGLCSYHVGDVVSCVLVFIIHTLIYCTFAYDERYNVLTIRTYSFDADKNGVQNDIAMIAIAMERTGALLSLFQCI